MTTPCQLIVDPPQSGTWNMAVDEWLLQRAAEQGELALRFYQWAEPTLSLGYFQAYAERQQHVASRGCPVVRRASGGGALVHDRELTYSLAVPADHQLARRAHDLYNQAHRALVAVLGELIPEPEGRLQLCPATDRPAGGEPFLCFLRRSSGDVLFEPQANARAAPPDGRHKICGSAQRKRRGAVLQHGGVLLGQSPAAPELPGLTELTSARITPGALGEAWLGPLAERLGLEPRPADRLTTDERQQVAGIEAAKFAHPAWTGRR